MGAAQPAQALRRMVEWDLQAQGSCATSERLFSWSLPAFPLVADAGAFSPVQRLRVAGGSILYSPCSFPAAELSKKLSKNTSHN